MIIDYDNNAKTILDYVIYFDSVRNQEGSGSTRLNNPILKELEEAIKSVGGKSVMEQVRLIKKLAKRTAILLSLISAIMIATGVKTMIKDEGELMMRAGVLGIGFGTAIAVYNASIIEFEDEIRFVEGIIERLNSVATTTNHTVVVRHEDALEVIPESVGTRVIKRLNTITQAFVHTVKYRPADTFGAMIGIEMAVLARFINRTSVPYAIALGTVCGSMVKVGMEAGFYITNRTMNKLEDKSTDVIRTSMFGTEISSLRSLNVE